MAPAARIVGYLRVSTAEQAEHGAGLDVQRRAIQAWARANRHRIVLWAVDAGVSGSNGLDTREGLHDALSALRENEAAGIVVYRLDRLARDLIIQETLLAEVRRLGGEVYSTSAAESAYLGDDPADPSRKLIRQVLGAVAEYERSMIRLRMTAGRRRKAEHGGYIGGLTTYGYQAEKGELVPDASQQATLARIAELRAGGASLREIAAMLTAEGFQPKRSSRWHPETLRRIVARLP